MPGKRSFRGRSGGRSSAPTYKWAGVQFPLTALASTLTAINLVDRLQIDEMGGATLLRIRGNIVVRQNVVSATEWGMKIVMENVDDLGAPTSDIQAIDTDGEDIARRQLWTRIGQEPTASAVDQTTRIDLEIDIKARVKLRAKQSLFLLMESTVARMSATGYLRCLLLT